MKKALIALGFIVIAVFIFSCTGIGHLSFSHLNMPSFDSHAMSSDHRSH